MNSHQLSISLVAAHSICLLRNAELNESAGWNQVDQPASQPANDTKNLSSTPSNLHTHYVSISPSLRVCVCVCVWVCDIHFRSVGFTNIKMCAHKFSIFSKFIHYRSSHFLVPSDSSLRSRIYYYYWRCCCCCCYSRSIHSILFRSTSNGIVCIHTFVSWLVGWLNCCVVVKVITFYLYFCWNNAFRVLHIPCHVSLAFAFTLFEWNFVEFKRSIFLTIIRNLVFWTCTNTKHSTGRPKCMLKNRPLDRHLCSHSFLLACIPFSFFFFPFSLSVYFDWCKTKIK